jgi:hypothetical protein
MCVLKHIKLFTFVGKMWVILWVELYKLTRSTTSKNAFDYGK